MRRFPSRIFDRSTRHETKRAFTLVEVMIVVTILGVLAALASYGLARYIKHAKTAEASRILGAIEIGQQAKFQVDTDPTGTGLYVHMFCSGAPAVPSSFAMVTARKYTSVAGDWSAVGWTCLHFAIGEPQFYQYATTSSGSGTAAVFTITGLGDLDGNGTLSTYQINGFGGANGDTGRASFVVINADE